MQAPGGRELAPAPAPARQAESSGGAESPASADLIIINAQKTLETVRAVQRELTALGYEPGPVDGAQGLMTRAAIMAFEYDNGLPLKAQATPELLQMILLGVPQSERGPGRKDAGLPVAEEARQVVQTVQQTLRGLGYEVGPVDGSFSVATERAIRDFETDQSLPETGRVSGRLIARMVRLADQGRIAFGN